MQQVVTEAPLCTLCSPCWGDGMCLGLCIHTQVTSPHAQPACLSTSGCLAGTAQGLGEAVFLVRCTLGCSPA